jgi:hypothetical protein
VRSLSSSLTAVPILIGEDPAQALLGHPHPHNSHELHRQLPRDLKTMMSPHRVRRDQLRREGA